MSGRKFRRVYVTDEIWEGIVARAPEPRPHGMFRQAWNDTLVSAALLHFVSLTDDEVRACLRRLHNHEPSSMTEPKTATTT